MATGVEKVEKLQTIEKEIGAILKHASEAIEELSKPQPSSEIVESKTKSFIKSLELIEQGLWDQISYLSQVSTTHAHEGSYYGSEKDIELVKLQSVLAKERLTCSGM